MSVKNIKLDSNSAPLMQFELDCMVPNPAIRMIACRGSGRIYFNSDKYTDKQLMDYYNEIRKPSTFKRRRYFKK
jgi:hypothetical protein